MSSVAQWILLSLLLLLQVLLLILFWKKKQTERQQHDLLKPIADAQVQQRTQLEELIRHLRHQAQDLENRHNQHAERVQQTFHGFQHALIEQLSQSTQIQTERLNQFADTLHRTNSLLNDQFNQIRQTLENKMKDLQQDNANKLEEMRRTVDEKLHATLEQRLGESFKQVSDRLEQVHKGLGEMQNLAAGVGDLKRVLTNVKSRGTWGEVQLHALLDQMLTPSQFAKNVKPIPNSNNIVEFAVRLPGKDEDTPVWLPIDSKFPKEQYERMLEAFDLADAERLALASKALEQAVRLEAKTLSEKYLSPPHTTDFGILFLPTEGLYAEVAKRPGLVDDLQRLYRVTIAGPVTLSALLNALQLGFKTLALEKRSSEVWTVLSAVKTEFGKFGDILAKTKDTLERAAKNIEQAETRSRVMQRKLKGMDHIPEQQASALLGMHEEAVDESQ